MTYRTPLAAAAVLALAGDAAAQPTAPPRRPVFSSYQSLTAPGGGYYGYGYGGPGFGFNPNGFGFGGNAQNAAILQQLNQTGAAVSTLQQFLAYGSGLQPYSTTGHGVVFNQLGHWYPTYSGRGVPVGAGGGGGGFGPPVGGPRAGVTGLMGSAMMGAGAVNAIGAARTSGNGIPVAQPKR